MKLLGNAAYDKSASNKPKHVDVAYVLDEGTSNFLNNSRFKRKMTQVANDADIF